MHGRVLRHDLCENGALERGVTARALREGPHVLAQGPQFQGALHGRHQPVLLHRFHQIVDGARLHTLDRYLQVLRGRHDDGGQVRVVGGDLLQERLSGQIRHGQVEHHHPDRVICQAG